MYGNKHSSAYVRAAWISVPCLMMLCSTCGWEQLGSYYQPSDSQTAALPDGGLHKIGCCSIVPRKPQSFHRSVLHYQIQISKQSFFFFFNPRCKATQVQNNLYKFYKSIVLWMRSKLSKRILKVKKKIVFFQAYNTNCSNTVYD